MRYHPSNFVDVAFDLTPIRYYGNPNSPWVSRVKRERGTNHAFVFAVASVAEPGFRPVIAVVLKRRSENHFDMMMRLLKMVTHRGILINHLLLDRGFYSSRVINHLEKKLFS